MSGAPALSPELRLRIVSALAMGIVVLLVTWLGGVPFRVLCGLGAIAVFIEWSSMTRNLTTSADRRLASALFAVFVLVILILPSPEQALALLVGIAILAALASGLLDSSRWLAGGLFYSGLAGLTLVLLREDGISGLKTILFLFTVVWTTDVMAYFVGKRLGGPKLAPSISPGKTWSGALGGVLFAAALGWAAAWAMNVSVTLPVLFALIVVLSIVSQIGDLFESWLKRRFAMKDSGSLIPGHGGIMDRVDGLVAASTALYAILVLSAGIDGATAALFAN